MSAVFTLFCLGAAVGVAALLDHWREMGRTDDAIREWLDATTQLSDKDGAP